MDGLSSVLDKTALGKDILKVLDIYMTLTVKVKLLNLAKIMTALLVMPLILGKNTDDKTNILISPSMALTFILH